MRVAATAVGSADTDTSRAVRRRLSLLSIFGMVAAVLVAIGGAPPAQAAQAPGHDVPAYQTGWSWTYATTFTYNDGAGTNATIEENVTYTVAGSTTFAGQDAYQLTIAGNITGGGGEVSTPDISADLEQFSGSVSGTRIVRKSDLALLQEVQNQHLNAKAKVGFITANVTADINLNLTPTPGWRTHLFPLNGGDAWHSDTDVVYSGGFSYDAGIGGSGNDTFDGTLPFDANVTVAAGSVSVPIGNIPTDNITGNSSDGTVDNHWWSPTHKADARHFMSIPMDDGATATIDRRLSAANTAASGTQISQTITPSLSCAGGDVTVAGTLSSGASGVPVTIRLDKSPVNPGQQVTANTTTTAGGAYSATIQAPSENDGMAKNSSRANWGVKVSAGSANNVATLVVTPKNCTTLVYNGMTGAEHGTTATASATLTDLAGGSVSGKTITFNLGGGAGAVNAVTNASGVATANIPVNGPPRTTTITAAYAGATNQEAANASSPFTVGKIGTTTTVAADPSIVTVGDPTTFTATVTPGHGGNAGGSVQFKVDGADFGAAVPLSGGTATSAPFVGALGFHDVVAVYLGTGDHAASESGPFTFRVRNPLLNTSTTSSVAPGTAVYGQPVTLSADVTSAGQGATGSVTFTSGSTTLATTGINGSGHAEVVVTDIPVGSHQVVATYSGDDVYAGSAASPKNLVVAKAEVDVALSSSDDTTVTGEAVSFSATVGAQAPGGGSPDGTVQLRIDGTDVGAPVELTGGTATFPTVTSLGAGNHTVAAVYAGTANYDGGQDTLTQVVDKADTSAVLLATPSPAVEESAATLTARIGAVAPGSGAPTGTVSFTANGDSLGAAPLEAVSGGAEAVLDISDLAAGTYTIVATYSGDGDYNGVSESISHQVIAAADIIATETVVTSSANPSTYGELVTFTANVTAANDTTPVGTVQFSVDGSDFGDPVPVGPDGVAESAALASPDPGDHTVIAAFTPAVGYSSSGDIITQTVDAAGVELALTSSDDSADYGQSVTFDATVSSQQVGTGTPTGHVQFVVDGQPLGDAVELDGDGGATSPPVANLLPGDHEVRALYSGDVHFRSAGSSLTQGVAKVATSTTLSATPGSVAFGETVTLSATVTPGAGTAGTPGGTVTFKRGSTTIASVPVAAGPGNSAVATISVSNLPAGSHAITAEYSGTAVFAASSSSPTTVSVGKLATSLKTEPALVKIIPLGLPLGMLKVTLTGGGQPVVGAPIEFRIGPNLICTSTTDAQGVATCNARPQLLQLTLALGYKASYAGDANHLPTQNFGTIIK